MPEYWDFTRPSRFARPSPVLAGFAAQHNITAPAVDPLTSLLGLSRTLFGAFRFATGNTSATSPIEHILETGQGVCQGYSHVMIAVAREWSVPARYISGYLHDDAPNGQSPSAPAMHAWVECRLPDIGWVGFDPTNDRLAGIDHVRVAAGRDYHDVAPTVGTYQGASDSLLTVEIRMERQPPD